MADTSAEGKSTDAHVILDAKEALQKIDHLGHDEENTGSGAAALESRVQMGVAVVSKSDDVKSLLDGVSNLLSSLPAVSRALEAVAKVHPFLEIAVSAFKIVIELELKRRDNDKKVKLLFLEMKNMMSALLQLKDVKAGHTASTDGVTIGTRLEPLINAIALDIKECANACDTYSKKRLIVRVFTGSAWDETLQGYIKVFTDRKAELNLAISLHTGVSIDSAVDKLDQLTTKTDVLLAFFKKAVPQEQRALASAVQQVGGSDAALSNPSTVIHLLGVQQRLETMPPAVGSVSATPIREVGMGHRLDHRGTSRTVDSHRQRLRSMVSSTPVLGGQMFSSPAAFAQVPTAPMSMPPVEVKALEEELRDPPTAAIQKNFVSFERKFRIMQDEMLRETRNFMAKEGDRVIESVLKGPHERIVDLELSHMWKEMRWRSIVKARTLVLAVHDHFLHKFSSRTDQADEDGNTSSPDNMEDSWTLEYINILRLQPIIEAFDDDASGFVSIAEVNRLASARPRDWSLLRWLAFWAIGWQVSCTHYKHKIYKLLRQMSKAMPTIRYANQRALDIYIGQVRPLVDETMAGFQEDTEHASLSTQFQLYIDEEEGRLRRALEIVNYDFDAYDTLALVNGRHSIEKNLYQLTYLLLSRHYEKVQAARDAILHPEELSDALASLQLVNDAFRSRYDELVALFTARKVDLAREFRVFACGMFARLSEPSAGGFPYNSPSPFIPPPPYHSPYFDDLDSDSDEDDADPSNADEFGLKLSEADEKKGSDHTPAGPSNPLKHPPHCENFYSLDEYEETDADLAAMGPIVPILGRWTMLIASFGYIRGRHVPFRQVLIVDFHASPTNRKQFVGVPQFHSFWPSTTATFTGDFRAESTEGRVLYAFTKTYDCVSIPDEYYRVFMRDDGMSLGGERDSFKTFDSTEGASVIMRKGVPPEAMVFYPHPQQLTNYPAPWPARLRWRYALSAVLHQARQRLCSWSLIRERGFRRRRFLYLVRCSLDSPLLPDAELEKREIANSLTPADYHFLAYRSLEPGLLPTFCPPPMPGSPASPPSPWSRPTVTGPLRPFEAEGWIPHEVVPGTVLIPSPPDHVVREVGAQRPPSPIGLIPPEFAPSSPASSTASLSTIQEEDHKSDAVLPRSPLDSESTVSPFTLSRAASPELSLVLASPNLTAGPSAPSPELPLVLTGLSNAEAFEPTLLNDDSNVEALKPIRTDDDSDSTADGTAEKARAAPNAGTKVEQTLRDELTTVKARLAHLEGLLEALIKTGVSDPTSTSTTSSTMRAPDPVDDDACSVQTLVG